MSKGLMLYVMLPIDMVEHFAEQKKMSAIDLCIWVADNNKQWASNVINENYTMSLNDLKHDFVGLMQDDEHFVPRL
tara:strand:- start:720 stop:947 length:228 start_codon:yes stop_codon:yes gene_type:complete